MRCVKCNLENPDGVLFCSNCGDVLGNLSEEDARLAAVLRSPGQAPSGTIDTGIPKVPGAPRTTPTFGIATISFMLSVVLLIASLSIYIYYTETMLFGDHSSWDYERSSLLTRALRYTGDLGWMAAAAGFAMILLGVAETQRRGEAFFWPAGSRVRTAAFVVLIALVIAGVGFAATAVTLEAELSQGAVGDLITRASFYAGSASRALLVAAAYLVASSFRRSEGRAGHRVV